MAELDLNPFPGAELTPSWSRRFNAEETTQKHCGNEEVKLFRRHDTRRSRGVR